MAEGYRRLDDGLDNRGCRAPSRLTAPFGRRLGAALASALVALAVAAAVVAAVAIHREGVPGLRQAASAPDGRRHSGGEFDAASLVALRALAQRVGFSGLCALALAPLVMPVVLGVVAAAAGVAPQKRNALVWDGSVVLWQNPEAQKVPRSLSAKLWLCLLFVSAAAGLAFSSLSASRPTPVVDVAALAGNASADTASNLTTDELIADELFLHPHAVMGFVATSVLGIVLVFCVAPRVLDWTVKFLIESLDRFILGTDVYLDNISVNVIKRSFVIEKLKVKNWTGFTKDYMMTIESCCVGFTIWPTLRSCGKKVELRWLRLDAFEVFMELKHGSVTPNVTHMVEYMDGVRRDDEGTKVAHYKNDIVVVVHEVKVSNISVHLPIGSLTMGVKDISFADLATIADKEGLRKLPDIVQFIMKTVVNEASAKGMETGQIIKKTAQAVGSRALYGANKASEEMRKKLEDMGGVFNDKKEELGSGIRDVLSHTGLVTPSAHNHERTSDISADGDPPVSAETLDRMKNALKTSGVGPKFLVPNGGLEENHFRYLAETTCCFVPVAPDTEAAAIFKALCHHLGRSRQKKIPQADFIQWINST